MPYIKPKAPPFQAVQRLLKGYDINATRLSALLGCSYNTARRLLERPGLLTLEKLDTICRRQHIPMEELREAITRTGGTT